MSKYKVIAIIGQAGSGKDTILHEVLAKSKNLNEIVSCTTRPPREGEKDGVNYYFMTVNEFTDKVMNDEMLEAAEFNGWFYGTSLDALREDKVNIGVFNPAGVESMRQDKNVDVYVYNIEVSDKTRLIRQLKRETNPDIDEVFRRFKTDREDFCDLDFHYNALTNETKADLKYAVKVIKAAAKALTVKLGQNN